MPALEYIRKRLLAILERLNMLDARHEALYKKAVSFISRDISPNDIAPDEYGCMESVSALLQKALPELCFPTLLSTRDGYAYFMKSPSFEQIDAPEPCCLILAVTGTGNGRVRNGHIGFVGKNTSEDGSLHVMSNNSPTGTWEVNFTVDAFTRYYKGKGGMEIIFLRVV